jgi:hypothetical protein
MWSTNEKIFPILTPNEQREIYPILKLTEEHERKIYPILTPTEQREIYPILKLTEEH